MPETVLRVLDANLNRAQEALRVLEDYARFVLDDRRASATVKQFRHDVQSLRQSLGADRLLAARDLAGDVGRDLKTTAEETRATPAAVAGAAFGRLTEALRSLSEYGKLLDPAWAAAVESLRYRAYELEARLGPRGELIARFAQVRLYVIVTAALCRGPWLETAEAAIRGGAGCLQLREKELTAAELLRRARQIRELTRRLGALLIVNDRPELARLAEADGVHLGQDDLPVADARRIVGAGRIIGKSTHSSAQFTAALLEQPDYLAVGPIYASATKPQEHLAGLDTFREVAPRSDVPLAAIGGITASNAAAVRAAGARIICVCSAVISQPDPAASAAALCSTLDHA